MILDDNEVLTRLGKKPVLKVCFIELPPETDFNNSESETSASYRCWDLAA